MSKNTFFKKRCHFWFWAISAETTIFMVFPGLHCFGPKRLFWPKQIACTKMHVFFSLPDTNSVRQFLQKLHFFTSFHFWMTTLKRPCFIGFFCLFPFCCFSFFCFSINIKTPKTKNAIFFSKTLFLISRQFCENTILAQCDTICVLNKPKNTKKLGENSEKKRKDFGPVFNFKLGPVLTLKPPKSWTKF